MKEKIMYLILGILIGAVITAGCFLVFSKDKGPGGRNGERPDFSDMSDEEREEMMKNRRENGDFERPDKPNGENNNEIPEDISSDVVEESTTNTAQ